MSFSIEKQNKVDYQVDSSIIIENANYEIVDLIRNQ